MNSNMSSPTSKSSSSGPTELFYSQAVLKLGEQIAAQLGGEHSDDLLCRWMAYFLAEKISASRQSTGHERAHLESEVFDVILKLWSNRHRYPDGMRPLEEFEPVIQLLASLTTENRFARYFSSPRQSGREGLAESDAQAKTWLDIADSVDDTARSVILYCLSAAIQGSKGEAEEWLQLVKAVGLEKENELPVVRILISSSGIAAEGAAEAAERQTIEDLLKRLRKFEHISQAIAANLEKKLAGESSNEDATVMPSIPLGPEK